MYHSSVRVLLTYVLKSSGEGPKGYIYALPRCRIFDSFALAHCRPACLQLHLQQCSRQLVTSCNKCVVARRSTCDSNHSIQNTCAVQRFTSHLRYCVYSKNVATCVQRCVCACSAATAIYSLTARAIAMCRFGDLLFQKQSQGPARLTPPASAGPPTMPIVRWHAYCPLGQWCSQGARKLCTKTSREDAVEALAQHLSLPKYHCVVREYAIKMADDDAFVYSEKVKVAGDPDYKGEEDDKGDGGDDGAGAGGLLPTPPPLPPTGRVLARPALPPSPSPPHVAPQQFLATKAKSKPEKAGSAQQFKAPKAKPKPEKAGSASSASSAGTFTLLVPGRQRIRSPPRSRSPPTTRGQPDVVLRIGEVQQVRHPNIKWTNVAFVGLLLGFVNGLSLSLHPKKAIDSLSAPLQPGLRRVGQGNHFDRICCQHQPLCG